MEVAVQFYGETREEDRNPARNSLDLSADKHALLRGDVLIH